MFDFANILFAGPCNARCPYCIGRQIDPRLNVNNLDEFPPRNLDRFIEMIVEHGIRQVVFTGTTTDPQLYRHEARLLDLLRQRLPVETQYSIHTNGRLALQKLSTFNLYDRACVSLPTFNPDTYYQMMGVRNAPNLAAIVGQAHLPVKVSCVIDEHNIVEIPAFLERCHAIGIRRLVFRKLYGDTREWNVTDGLPQRGDYRRNPVFDYNGMEVTCWDFDRCESTSINLFSTGMISQSYLLAETQV
jgi:molybdenum cofactor biosynthesis enzyme MoaA